MGKNTWLSIGEKALPKRDNLILSKSLYSQCSKNNACKVYHLGKAQKVFCSIDNMKNWCREKKYEEIWIIGGESIYKEFINDSDTKELWITKINKEFDCDTFFPVESISTEWKLCENNKLETNCGYDVDILSYSRN